MHLAGQGLCRPHGYPAPICVVFLVGVLQVRDTVEAISTAATDTQTTAPWEVACNGLRTCRALDQCSTCFDAIRIYSSPTNVGVPSLDRAAQAGFLQTLLRTPSCQTNVTSSALFSAVLSEVFGSTCLGADVNHDPCYAEEYRCFSHGECGTCLANLYNNPDRTAAVLNSTACQTSVPLLQKVSNAQCFPFPDCTFNQNLCRNSRECARCLETLRAGDGAGAARQCNNVTSAPLMDNLVHGCVFANVISCDYWRQRCTEQPACGQCLTALDGATSRDAIVGTLMGSSCASARSDVGTSKVLLFNAFTGCLSVRYSRCQILYAQCTIFSVGCAYCLSPTTPLTSGFYVSAVACEDYNTSYGIPAACQTCPNAIHTINSIVRATSTIGIVSLLMCFVPITLIFAHGQDRISLRSRIIVGLFLANAAYSSANVLPLNRLKVGPNDCGQLFLSFPEIRAGRAWWFFGKYCLVLFEWFILGASVWTLSKGHQSFLRSTERCAFIACVLGGLIASAGFYVHCSEINAEGYNADLETRSQMHSFNHAGETDDRDDDAPNVVAAQQFDAARNSYDALVQLMLRVWLGFLAVAIVMWFCLRSVYRTLVQFSRHLDARMAELEAADEWADTRRTAWKAKKDFIQMQRIAYATVAAPLEVFVIMFIIFGAPACVMATSFCRQNSGASLTGSSAGVGANEISYGTCDAWCELVLSLRSIATVVAYFNSRSRREELYNFRKTFRLLVSRVLSLRSPTRFPDEAASSIPLTPFKVSEALRIHSDDVKLSHALARGAYGEVWMATWKDKKVAVKIIFGSGVDCDGDVIDPQADEEFVKEISVLGRLNHPHVISFFGYGHMNRHRDSAAFIVVELMARGSLRSVLQDDTDLNWSARLQIALEIALGMEYLHSVPIVHRDLKSANVLLSETFTAKIADFGTSRLFRPRDSQLIFSAFTGTAVPANLNGAMLTNTMGKFAPSRISISVVDAHGNMTKATGTLLWMSPEAFRGDQSYGPAVDVYSFAVVLWELATRQRPWDELGTELTYIQLCEQLTRALQNGRRLTIPQDVAEKQPGYARLIRECWVGDPAERPTFSSAVRTLRKCCACKLGVGPGTTMSSDESAALSEPLLSETW